MTVIRINRHALAMALGVLLLIGACFAGLPSLSVLTDGSSIISRVPVDTKLVALTFDDGPDPLFTQQVLDQLAAYNARGTFFVLGIQVEQFPEVLRATALAGHEIASHGWAHRVPTHLSADALLAEIKRSEFAIKEAAGAYPVCWRPPCGIFNASNVRVLRERSYSVILWDVDPKDWERPGAAVIAERVLSRVRPGSVVLLHDSGGDRTQTMAALAKILAGLSKQGYQFVTVSDLIRARSVNEPQ